MSSINVKVQSEEGEIRRFSASPSFSSLKASLSSRFYNGNGLKVTYKDESDDDVCLSNDEDLETALHITGASDGAKTLKLKVAPQKDGSGSDTHAFGNLRLETEPLQKQFKQALKSGPSLLALMQDPALGAQEKAKALPSPQLQQWYLDHQHVVAEKLAKLQTKMDCGRFGRPECGKGKGAGGGKCGKGKGGAACFKGGKGGPHGHPHNHRMQHAMHRLQYVLSSHPEVAQQLLAEPQSLQALSEFHKLHQFCLNHPEVLKEQLDLFHARQLPAQSSDAADATRQPHLATLHTHAMRGQLSEQPQPQQQWVPMRHRIVRYLSNHDEARAALHNDSSVPSIDAAMANKPGMLRFLQSSPSELPALLEEAEAAVAARGGANTTAADASAVKRPVTAEKKEKKPADQQQKKARKLEHKQLKVRVKIVKYLTKHQKALALLRADPTAATAATVFSSKPKLNQYLAENADAIPQFVEEAVVMSAEADTSSSSEDAMEEEAVVVVNPGMEA